MTTFHRPALCLHYPLAFRCSVQSALPNQWCLQAVNYASNSSAIDTLCVVFFLLLSLFFPARQQPLADHRRHVRPLTPKKRRGLLETRQTQPSGIRPASARDFLFFPPLRSFSLLLSRTMPSDCTPTLEVFERLAERLIVLPQSQGPKTIST